MDTILSKSNPVCIEFPVNSNKYIAFLPWRELQNILRLPDIQREVDYEWVDTLHDRIVASQKKTGVYDIGRLTLCSYSDESLYLIDGQHRYMVLEKLDNQNVHVEIVIHRVDNEEKMNELFMQVNASRPLYPCKNTHDQLVFNGVRKYFATKYRSYVSKSASPLRPNINLNVLTELIEKSKIVKLLRLHKVDDLVNVIEDLNKFYKSRIYDQEFWTKYQVKDIGKVVDKIHAKSTTAPLYLGIYNDYEWIDRLAKHCTSRLTTSGTVIEYDHMPHFTRRISKKCVPRTVKPSVWESTKVSSCAGKCYVCMNDIDSSNFECGYLKSLFWGDEVSLDNLKVICKECYEIVGTQDLDVYKNVIRKKQNEYIITILL